VPVLRVEVFILPYYPTVKDSIVPSSQLHGCCHAWMHKGCPALCWPIRVPICIADYIGRCFLICWANGNPEQAINDHPNDPGCCTACVFEHFPLCMPDLCMTKDPRDALGVFCADNQCGSESRYHDPRCRVFWKCFWCPLCVICTTMGERWSDRYNSHLSP
jgi:hypothetical protein